LISRSASPSPRLIHACLAGAVAIGLLMTLPSVGAANHGSKGVKVDVMTRNIFLGADLGPALAADTPNEFVEANGGILREVEETDFPRRAHLLAEEIEDAQPDLVGLQEVALWREGPPAIGPALNNEPVATEVRYDFLSLLLDALNQGVYDEYSGYEEGAYMPVVVQQEFDFEAPANENGEQGDGPNGFIPHAEVNGRLTMRDVILARVGSGINVKNATGGHFQNLLEVTVGGVVVVPVTRGWTQLDATAKKKVKKGKHKGKTVKKKFRFVNSHFEAFDDETQQPSIRAQQAQELLDGPANDDRAIILGDFNSDSPGVQPGDEQAYEVLLAGGFEERSTDDPLSCCVSDLFTSPPSEFDHQVDHVMTNMGGDAVLKASSVSGLRRITGIYPSDHAGVFSTLKLK
jgi:endonuclease/exonuclease/phosphatase family metal-dependent hydrolase